MIPTPRRKNSGARESVDLQEIAKLVGGELSGDPHTRITGVSGIREAKPGEITFLSNPKYTALLDETKASAVIVSSEIISAKTNLIRTQEPSKAFNKVIALFTPLRLLKEAGIHPKAVVHETAKLGKEVYLGPGVVVEAGVIIGDRTVVEANSFIGDCCVIGQDVKINPNVTILHQTEIGDRSIIHSGSVLGSDGFGYETLDGEHIKIPQTGRVVIESDVEIGANVCIDRARFDKTWIKKGTKIDNLVQIAHNVVIGESNLLVSQCGVSGSSRLGDRVIVAGQAGIVGHIEIGDDAIVGAGSGVTKSVPAKSVVLGGPARPIQDQKKIYVLIGRLPELFKELSDLKKKFISKEEMS